MRYNLTMEKSELDSILVDFEKGTSPTPGEIQIQEPDSELWVRFKVDPKRFAPSIFDGEWAFTQHHPVVGSMRILRVITGTDGISRIIARQGKFVYAYPWFK
jgi:hypothetical protein